MKVIDKVKEKYALTRSVKLVDVKGYLKEEYKRATERENLIFELEDEIKNYKIIEQKYEAMLVIQEETTKRIERQDNQMAKYREEIKKLNDKLKVANSKNIDIEINFKKIIKTKDAEIKELQKQVKVKEKEK